MRNHTGSFEADYGSQKAKALTDAVLGSPFCDVWNHHMRREVTTHAPPYHVMRMNGHCSPMNTSSARAKCRPWHPEAKLVQADDTQLTGKAKVPEAPAADKGGQSSNDIRNIT